MKVHDRAVPGAKLCHPAFERMKLFRTVFDDSGYSLGLLHPLVEITQSISGRKPKPEQPLTSTIVITYTLNFLQAHPILCLSLAFVPDHRIDISKSGP
jgi:hypothetical protein